MSQKIRLEYLLREDGRHVDDNAGVPVTLFNVQHLYSTELVSAHTIHLDAIIDVLEFMEVEYHDIERISKDMYRVHVVDHSPCVVLWAQVMKEDNI